MAKKQTIEFTEVIKKKHKIVIEKFDDFVWVERNGNADVFLRDFFDEQEAKHARKRNKSQPDHDRLDYKWVLGLDPYKHGYIAFSAKYLSDCYFKGGKYTYEGERYVNPLPLLRGGKASGRFFQDRTGNDGFLYFRGKPVLRPIPLELWKSYYQLKPLLEKLKASKKISDIEVVPVPYYNQEICGSHEIHCLYHPSKQEFERMQKGGEFWSCRCKDRAIEALKIDKCRRKEDEDISSVS